MITQKDPGTEDVVRSSSSAAVSWIEPSYAKYQDSQPLMNLIGKVDTTNQHPRKLLHNGD